MAAQQLLNVLCCLAHSFLRAVIAIDQNYKVGSVKTYLCTFVIAGRGSHASLPVTVYRQAFNIHNATSYALVRLTAASYSQRQGIATELIGVEAANAVAIAHGGKVDKVYEGVTGIEFLSLKHTADKSLGGRTVA